MIGESHSCQYCWLPFFRNDPQFTATMLEAIATIQVINPWDSLQERHPRPLVAYKADCNIHCYRYGKNLGQSLEEPRAGETQQSKKRARSLNTLVAMNLWWWRRRGYLSPSLSIIRIHFKMWRAPAWSCYWWTISVPDKEIIANLQYIVAKTRNLEISENQCSKYWLALLGTLHEYSQVTTMARVDEPILSMCIAMYWAEYFSQGHSKEIWFL